MSSQQGVPPKPLATSMHNGDVAGSHTYRPSQVKPEHLNAHASPRANGSPIQHAHHGGVKAKRTRNKFAPAGIKPVKSDIPEGSPHQTSALDGKTHEGGHYGSTAGVHGLNATNRPQEDGELRKADQRALSRILESSFPPRRSTVPTARVIDLTGDDDLPTKSPLAKTNGLARALADFAQTSGAPRSQPQVNQLTAQNFAIIASDRINSQPTSDKGLKRSIAQVSGLEPSRNSLHNGEGQGNLNSAPLNSVAEQTGPKDHTSRRSSTSLDSVIDRSVSRIDQIEKGKERAVPHVPRLNGFGFDLRPASAAPSPGFRMVERQANNHSPHVPKTNGVDAQPPYPTVPPEVPPEVPRETPPEVPREVPPDVPKAKTKENDGIEGHRLAMIAKHDPVAFDTQIYAQEGAQSPPPGISLKKPDAPKKRPDYGPRYIRADPRIHGMHSRSEQWHREKAEEIRRRGNRKRWFGQPSRRKQWMEAQAKKKAVLRTPSKAAVSRQKEVEPRAHRTPVDLLSVPQADLPEYVKENPAWLRTLARMRRDKANQQQDETRSRALRKADAEKQQRAEALAREQVTQEMREAGVKQAQSEVDREISQLLW